ncbi:flavin reductase family protein [Maribacter hydrothermalis]|uniref:Flavin oxidoreductase n=1 Tax=Maribacter hydrothermalis TaxID=1836467 RepID=A0A1B7ZCJ2_9FLAO|nr:flavin reductase [Maribacter hydrothermalis]APQ18605.1 flavin oxidoreductase [Maribacter hydrothermalis]OBR40839.1 flavin oxidoreductase [Maribacter hydrothermalis]
MMYTKEAIENMDRITRLKLFNAISGIKSANLIGTIGTNGTTNLAIFNSVVHIGSDPALVGFISRPQTSEVGHTLRNIQENGHYTINHVHPEFIKNAHYTSAKFEAHLSEFKQCKLTEEYTKGFQAPFVKESTFKMGVLFKEAIEIKLNGTFLVIGEIDHVMLPKNSFVDDDINLELTKSVGVSGLNTYYSLKKLEKHPFVRIHEVPKFLE